MDDKEKDELRKEQEKHKLFNDLIGMDFTETSLKNMLSHPYEVDDDDEDLQLNPQGFLKLMKMFSYKIALTFKR